MNIVFSTTRQWNPGDEFILLGCINLLKKQLGEFNSIIFNRNPQIRRHRKFDIITALDDLVGKDLAEKFQDNSVKNRLPMDYADMVVFAGSPEWRGLKMRKLYAFVRELKLPSLFLGIGTGGAFKFTDEHFSKDEQEVLRKAKLIAVRDGNTAAGLAPLTSHHLPCPALFSSKTSRPVTEVKRICLGYSTNNGVQKVANETYEWLTSVYNHIVDQMGARYQIDFVAHYIDELHDFQQDFPGRRIRYSYDSKDYLDIYNEYDLVIGPRVHGIGLCASQGTPGILIGHDERAYTAEGFKSPVITAKDSLESVMMLVQDRIDNIEKYSRELIEHKEKTEQRYLTLLKEANVCSEG